MMVVSSISNCFLSWTDLFFFHGISHLLERVTNRQIYDYSDRYLANIFSKLNKVSLSNSRKKKQYLLPMIKLELSSTYQNFEKLVSVTMSLTISQLKGFPVRLVVILTNVILKNYTIFQYLEDTYNSGNENFPNGQCMIYKIIHK